MDLSFVINLSLQRKQVTWKKAGIFVTSVKIQLKQSMKKYFTRGVP